VIYDDGYYDDGYYDEPAPALITAQWHFQDLATQTETGCPAGFDTVALHSQALDRNGRATGPLVIDLFDCIDGGGTSDWLYPDVYQTWLEVSNFDRTRIYAESTSTVVDVIERDATVESQILNDGGYFSLSWDLVGATSNRTLACSEIGATQIELGSTSDRGAITDQFACADRFGVTGGFVQGDYALQLTAKAAGGATLGEPVTLDNKTIRDRNRITDLGFMSIPIANR